jgi:hypothetical protein
MAKQWKPAIHSYIPMPVLERKEPMYALSPVVLGFKIKTK